MSTGRSDGETEAATRTSQDRDWSSLPTDLLIEILRRLRWSSHPSFALACSHWRSAVSPFYPASVTPLLLNAASCVRSTNARFYSPYFDKIFELAATLHAPGAKICGAAGRRLTLALPHLVRNVDLGTGVAHEMPPVPQVGFDFVVYDDGDGVGRMVGVGAVMFLRLQAALSVRNGVGGWTDWDFTPYELGPTFVPSPSCNPVFHGGLLYLLGQDGRLAVYDQCMHDQGFEILDKPLSFGFECQDSYLVESDQGELMAVLVGLRGPPVNLVKLNKHTMEWDKVESLEGSVLFTGTLTTTMKKKTGAKWMQNRIFLPRLFHWPEIISVDLVQHDGELAFVPSQECTWRWRAVRDDAYAGNMWTYKLGQSSQGAREFWETEKLDYSVWVDFSK
ncbi:hypothetical protein D1007_05459 [Hordeum vulgare]|uniref:F-box domain-containing protein n=1 Tax=Hordeum vulgare subsp. vulgare TaxID=112509 RepID=A0A8I6XKW2_HORVV|nr:hypothetical protein D1007_05459 [Hordeum vulgare]KAI5005664.1 hypothetical protein ZWY2020_032907 [Hordeum vulgare]